MDHEALYREFRQRQLHERQRPALSSEPSLHRIMAALRNYPDDQLVDLQSTIPILRSCGIFLALESVASAKEKLEQGDAQNHRLTDEARLVFYLWHMIDQDEIECKQLKDILVLLASRDSCDIHHLFEKKYGREENVANLIQAWSSLFTPSIMSEDNSKTGSPIYKSYSGKRTALADTSNIVNREFNFTCQMNEEQEKELVARLYRTDQYEQREVLRKKKEEQKQQEELSKCTFKPAIAARGKSANQSRPRPIRGFQKAVSRLKVGSEKSKVSRQLREYKPIGQNYEKLRQQKANPPRFLSRQKKQEKVLFIISFDLGRHKTNVKIRESDNEDSVAERLCRIYSLKREFYEEIRSVVREQLEAYYQELYDQEVLQQ